MSAFAEYFRRTWEDTDGDISDQQTEHANRLRIPILTTGMPRWNYITGIVVGDRWPFIGVMPTEDEITAVAAQLESYNRGYRASFLDAMRQFAPYDIDGGANLGYYLKRPDGLWTWRKRTWRGPEFSNGGGSLDEVLERNFKGWSWLNESTANTRGEDDEG